jgi:DNA invertase Pin-like site-specific DNA recombinase
VTKQIIGYLRVSTERQGASGLGLDAQGEAIAQYARTVGAKVTAWYTEVESGRDDDRPELAKALAHAKRSKATLCVGKLDRLSRSVEFLARVMNSGADFVACDNPAANRLTLHILAAVAEAEAKAISERTKAALAAAKARGTLLGSARPGHWNGREATRQLGAKRGAAISAKARTQAAQEAYQDLLPVMITGRAEGLTLAQIAAKLNAEGHTTRRGCPWNHVQVLRVLQRGRTTPSGPQVA